MGQKKNILEELLDKLSKQIEKPNTEENIKICVSMVDKTRSLIDDKVAKNIFIKKSLNNYLDLLIEQINNTPIGLL